MVKDRLEELKQNTKKGKEKPTVIEVDNNNTEDEADDENKKLRQAFERADVIGQWIEQMEDNNQNIRTLLRRTDDMKFNQKDVEERLKALFQNNTSIAHQVTGKLRQVDGELKEMTEESTEKRIKFIQYSSLKKRFENVFLENNKLLENYKTIEKQIIKSQLVVKGYFNVTDEEVALLLEEGTDIQVFTENILAETSEAKRILADVEERHQQLLQIERMLQEVRDLFMQMAILIESQQELVDRIEYQAQAATEYVGAGTVDLEKSKKSKEKYLKLKIYLLIAVTIVIIIILLILFKG